MVCFISYLCQHLKESNENKNQCFPDNISDGTLMRLDCSSQESITIFLGHRWFSCVLSSNHRGTLIKPKLITCKESQLTGITTIVSLCLQHLEFKDFYCYEDIRFRNSMSALLSITKTLIMFLA